MAETDVNVGKKIRALRNKKGVSLNGLAGATGIAASNLSSIELGKTSPTLNTLVKIASAFGFKASEFLDEVIYEKAILCKPSDFTLIRSEPHLTEYSVTQGIALNHIHAKLLEIKGSGLAPVEEPVERLIFCIQGNVIAQVETNVFSLSRGSALYLMPEAKALLENKDTESALLFIITTSGI
jgi:XRE family transcriptional regulator, regulator of sulfur utilization